ncbi:MAG: response regulator transcription factor [Gammaproteobacteria bacterium]
MTIIVTPKHVALSKSNDVKRICEPFFNKTGISSFTFARQYSNHSRFSLTTEPTFGEFFFNHKLYRNLFSQTGSFDNYTLYWLWSSLPTTQLQLDMQAFNIFNGITIIQAHKEFIEYFYFGAKSHETHMNNFYINNLDLLHNFILFFKDQANELISLSKNIKHRLILPEVLKQESTETISYYESIKNIKHDQVFEINKITYDHFGSYLTKREVDCACEIIQGLSNTEIGEKLFISKRTVDIHVVNLKSKLNCDKKSQLIKKLFELKIHYLI